MMRADLILVSELGPGDLAAWRQLAARAVTPNPFFEPEFVLPAATAFGVTDLGMLVVRDSSDWRAAVPVRRVRSWRRVPGTTLAAWIHHNCLLGTPLIAGTDIEAELAELLNCAGRAGACLALERLDADPDGPAELLATKLGAAARSVVVDEYERATLHRREAPDYLEQALNGHHRRELRRTFRHLAGEVGELRVDDCSDEPTAYDRFLEIERASWKGKAGTALATLPGQTEFFRTVCRGFASAERLELLALRGDTRTVAMKCNLRAGDVTFCFKITFDETLARYSPGMHLEVAHLERFHAGPSALADSCAQRDNAMINRLWPGRRRLRTVVALPRRSGGSLAFAKWRAAAPVLRAMTERHRRNARNVPRD